MANESASLPTECPDSDCDGRIQATSKLYWTIGDNGWELEDAAQEELHLYCSNDHELRKLMGDDNLRPLYDALAERVVALGVANVADVEHYLTLTGIRPPN